MLLAFFQPLEFPDSFNQAIAINTYAETICNSQTSLEVARGEASQAAMEAFNRHRQRHIFPLELMGAKQDSSLIELVERWDKFSQKVCPERFEAYTRARQLGGAEARVGLVCIRDDTVSLRSELEEAKRLRNVRVFGRQDLGDLAQKIGEWVSYSC